MDGKKKQLAATQQYTADLHQDPLKCLRDIGTFLSGHKPSAVRRLAACLERDKLRAEMQTLCSADELSRNSSASVAPFAKLWSPGV